MTFEEWWLKKYGSLPQKGDALSHQEFFRRLVIFRDGVDPTDPEHMNNWAEIVWKALKDIPEK